MVNTENLVNLHSSSSISDLLRIIENFGYKGTLNITQLQCPRDGQNLFPLDLVAPSDLGRLQGFGTHNFPGQAVPRHHHPHRK